MKDQLASTNKAVIAGIMVMLIVAMTLAWYMLAFKADRVTIKTNQLALDAANTTLAAKKADLAKVNVDKSPDRSAIPKIMLGRTAIPADPDIAGGILQMQDIAKKSGVVLTKTGIPEDDGQLDSTASTEPQPTRLQIEGHAPYAQIMMFVSNLEAPVSSQGGKLYVAGRLMNVESLSFDDGVDSQKSQGDASMGVGVIQDGVSKLPPGHRTFKITLVMYSVKSSTATSTDGSATDPAAAAGSSTAGTTPAAGTGTSTSTTPTDGSAGGSTTGTTPAGGTTDGSSTGGNPATPAAGSSVPSGAS